MTIQRVTCIQMSSEFPDFTHRLVMPDYGLPVIGTILRDAGYDVTVYVENIKAPEWERIAESDLVCFSSLNGGADKLYGLADRIKRELGIPVVMGGTHASYYPDTALEHVDYVVFGEGDETILDLVAALSAGTDLEKVDGIGYRENGRTIRTRTRQGPERFDTVPDFELIEGYPTMSALDMVRKFKRPLLTAQTSRGCQFKCTFCIVNTMFERGYRKRDIESVIRDLRDKRRYSGDMLLVDNDFAAMRPYTKKLLERIIEEDLGYDMVVFSRIEVVKDDEILELMRRAGITHIYQGYESVQPGTLDAYDKHQTVEGIVAAIQKLHSYGFHILGSFVVGADTDTPESLARTVDFVREQKLTYAYFFPIWGHYPEQMNGYRTITPWYRSIFRGWKWCDGNHVTHYPSNLPPSKLQQFIVDAYGSLYSLPEVGRATRQRRYGAARGKLAHWFSWRALEEGMQEHVAFLEELEEGLYDAEGRLMEDRLIERVQADPRWAFQEGNRTIESLGLSPLELPTPVSNNIKCVPTKLGEREAASLAISD
jgi:radical SAM superfamily enzyme YgiQ (UPF0313 family)